MKLWIHLRAKLTPTMILRRIDMENDDKILRYSLQVSYLGILIHEGLLNQDEYEKCMKALRKDYGIVSDILVNK